MHSLEHYAVDKHNSNIIYYSGCNFMNIEDLKQAIADPSRWDKINYTWYLKNELPSWALNICYHFIPYNA